MELVHQHDDVLKASIAGVVELLGSSITTTEADVDKKVRETQAAVQTLHDHLCATAPTVSEESQADPKSKHTNADLKQNRDEMSVNIVIDNTHQFQDNNWLIIISQF